MFSLSLNHLLKEKLWDAEFREGVETWSEIGVKQKSKLIYTIRNSSKEKGKELAVRDSKAVVRRRKLGRVERAFGSYCQSYESYAQ